MKVDASMSRMLRPLTIPYRAKPVGIKEIHHPSILPDLLSPLRVLAIRIFVDVLTNIFEIPFITNDMLVIIPLPDLNSR